MSTKYILHGGFTRIDNDLNRIFFNELVKDVHKNSNVLMCFFATEDDKTDVFFELSEKIQKQSTKNDFSFTLADKDKFIDQLKKADVIYFHGGHTRILLNELIKYRDLKQYLSNKIVAGSSAGAYALAKFCAAHDEEHMREGLGFLPLRVVCHYQSKELPPTEASLSELKNVAQELELVLLRDCECRIFTE